MATTIQISNKTLDKLKRLKQEKKLASYNEIIEYLIAQENNTPTSMFGSMKGKMEKFEHDQNDRDHE